jgi:Peptidase M15
MPRMRLAFVSGLLTLLVGPSSLAQTISTPDVAPWQVTPWSPTAEYVTSGQDEAGYRRWITADPQRMIQVAAFHQYLNEGGVAFVVPTWQLLRTASDWGRCGAAPFEVPPIADWANLIQTLRFVRDYVVPSVGAVEPVSAYRNPTLNQCAGGAPESAHMHFSAVDLVPMRPIDRPDLMRRLCALHYRDGARYQVGLGFYTKLRFHVDSWKYRTWGRSDAGTLACPMPLAQAPRPPDLTVMRPAAQPVDALTVHRPPVDPLAPTDLGSPR